jgi:hypothetical protein
MERTKTRCANGADNRSKVLGEQEGDYDQPAAKLHEQNNHCKQKYLIVLSCCIGERPIIGIYCGIDQLIMIDKVSRRGRTAGISH